MPGDEDILDQRSIIEVSSEKLAVVPNIFENCEPKVAKAIHCCAATTSGTSVANGSKGGLFRNLP